MELVLVKREEETRPWNTGPNRALDANQKPSCHLITQPQITSLICLLLLMHAEACAWSRSTTQIN
jgi:hypothetical protein